MISLRTIVLTTFIALVAFSVAAEGIFLYSNTQQAIKLEVENHLTTAAESRAAHIKTFLEDKKAMVKSSGGATVFRNLFSIKKTDPSYADLLLTAKKRLIELESADPDFFECFIIDSNGIIVASSDSTKEGLDRSKDAYFIDGKSGIFLKDIYYSEVIHNYGLTISYPILDFNNNFLGIFVARVSIDSLSKITSLRSGLGESGEIFLTNSEGYMLTPSRYVPDVIMKKKVETLLSVLCLSDLNRYVNGANNALVNSKKFIGVYDDYRGISSLGTCAFISPDANWSLFAEVDESEALGEFLFTLEKNTLLIGGVLLVIISILGYFFSNILISQIKKLSSSISQITRGNLDVGLSNSRIIEIQTLVDSLNRVLASMKLAMLRADLSMTDVGLGEAIKAKEAAENKYKVIYDSSLDAILTISPPNWVFTSANPAAVKMFSAKSEKDFIEESLWGLSANKQADGSKSEVKAKQFIDKSMREGSASFEWVSKRFNGEEFPALLILSKMNLGGKEILQVTIRDLTEEKHVLNELRNSEESFKKIFEQAPVAMYLNDLEGKLVDGNKFALKLVGYAKEELVGKSLFEAGLIKSKDIPRGIKWLAMNVAGKSTGPDRVTIIRKDKSEVVVEMSSQPIKLSGKKLVLASLHEIDKNSN